MHFIPENSSFDKSDLNEFLQQKGYVNFEIKEVEASIEDCFMRLMKKNN